MDSRVKLYCIFTWKTQSKKLNSSALSEMIWKFYGFFRRAGMSVPMTRNNYHGYLSFSNRGKPTYTPPQEMLFNNCPILIDHEFDWSSFNLGESNSSLIIPLVGQKYDLFHLRYSYIHVCLFLETCQSQFLGGNFKRERQLHRSLFTLMMIW